MKQIQNIIYVTFVICSFASCRKAETARTPYSSLKIINMVVNGGTVKKGSSLLTVASNTDANFSITAGSEQLYIFPVTDSLKPYYQNSFASVEGEIYSLFLGGTTASVESVLIKETLPNRSDSSFGVRFINLSPGSPAIKVTLSTSATTSEFSNLAYKQFSEYKTYSATAANPTYTFQVRNASTDAVITSFTVTGTTIASGIPVFRNITLVLRGIVGGLPAAGITRVNHFL